MYVVEGFQVLTCKYNKLTHLMLLNMVYKIQSKRGEEEVFIWKMKKSNTFRSLMIRVHYQSVAVNLNRIQLKSVPAHKGSF